MYVIGESKFGKSSLVNHLLGVKVADDGKLPKTWRVDLYRPATDGAESADVTRYNLGKFGGLTIADAKGLCDEQENAVLDRADEARSPLQDAGMQDLVAFDGQITQVDWYRDNLALDDRLTIVDTPGFAQPRGRVGVRADALRRGSGVAFDLDDICEIYYDRADLVLWTLNATKLEDADTLGKLKLLSSPNKRILGVITYWDRIEEADREGRLREARRRYGDYVAEFVCVDCKGPPGVPKEGIALLQEKLRGEADRAAEVKLGSARTYCSNQAEFAAGWLQKMGDGLVHNVAEVAMYCNAASDLLLRSVAASQELLLRDVDDKLSAAEPGLLEILQPGGTQEQKRERIGKYLQISDFNDHLSRRLRGDGDRLQVQGSSLASQRNLQQVVIKGRGEAEYRSLGARIESPKADGLAVSLSGVAVPAVDEGFMDTLFVLFQGSWVGNVAEFFGGRSAEDRQAEAVQKTMARIRSALRDQVEEAAAAFTRAGAEAILAGANSGIAQVYPGQDLHSLRGRAALIDGHAALLPGVGASSDVHPHCESHYTLWSPVDDGRQVVLALFCGWFEAQQAGIRAEIAPWGGDALGACPPPLAFLYACVRDVIDATRQWFAPRAPIPLKRLASRRNPRLDVNKLMGDDAWLGKLAAILKSREPFPEGGRFLREVFPELPDDAFIHFRLGGLGRAFSSRLGGDFMAGCRARLAAAPPVDVDAEIGRVRFSLPSRLTTRSFLWGTAGGGAFSGLAALLPLLGDRLGASSQGGLGAVAGLYAAQLHALLHSVWAAGRAGVAVLMIQYLFFLRDKHRLILSAATEKASLAMTQACASAWEEVVGGLDSSYARTVAAEYTLTGMRPLDYARDGLVARYRSDGQK